MSPKLLQSLFDKFNGEDLDYIYADLSDLGLTLSAEVISQKGLDKLLKNENSLYLPDGCLNGFVLEKSKSYIYSVEDLEFYYKDHWDDYYKYPQGVNIEPSVSCNLSCVMCRYRDEVKDIKTVGHHPGEYQ